MFHHVSRDYPQVPSKGPESEGEERGMEGGRQKIERGKEREWEEGKV